MDANHYFETLVSVFIVDLLRYLIPAGMAFFLFWKLFKKRFLHRFIQSTWPNSRKLWFEFRYSMSTICIFAIIGTGIVIAENNDLTQLYKNIEDYGRPYLILSFLIMIIFHDTYFYWTHRWMHHPKIFKYVHRIHHKSTNPSPWAAYSFHPIEAVVQALVFPILIFSIPVHTAVAFTFLIYMIIRNVWGHLSFELFPKGFTKSKWFGWHTTTTHHNMHHELFHFNYGLYFTWWDKWCKTEHKEYTGRFEEISTRSKNSKNRSKIVKILILLSIISAPSGYPQSPEGKWITYNESTGDALSIITIDYDKQTEAWYGVIDSVILQPYEGTNPLCVKCPGERKNARVIGMEFLTGFTMSENEWTGGEILDPSTGESYKGKIGFKDPKTIYVRGYGGPFGLFFRTQIWRKKSGDHGIEGLWETIDDQSKQAKSLVELKVEGDGLKGYIRKIYLLPHEGNYPVCIKCKGKLKDQPVVGMRFMNGFKKLNDKWIGGSVLDPGNGETYSAQFWLEGADSLRIRGFLGPLYRTQTWTRHVK